MKKIMFNDKYGLTEAVLAKRKTQTRRFVAYPNYINGMPVEECQIQTNVKGDFYAILIGEDGQFLSEGFMQPAYKLGETIAIAQKYQDLINNDEFYRLCGKSGMPLEYIGLEKGRSNKMFVRADLMPHHIRIINIRVERLQDISNQDCLEEGIWRDDNVGLEGTTYWYHGLGNSSFRTPQDAYASLIDRISGKGIWESNPYVFVYDFELID